MKILFVCTGNTCRSPMAHVMAAKLLGEGYTTASAGIMAAPDAPASAHAIAVMKERELDLSAHRSQLVTEALLEEADIICAMTFAHKSALIRLVPPGSPIIAKVRTLGAHDVSDPFGGDIAVYRACADEIYTLLEKIKEAPLGNIS